MCHNDNTQFVYFCIKPENDTEWVALNYKCSFDLKLLWLVYHGGASLEMDQRSYLNKLNVPGFEMYLKLFISDTHFSVATVIISWRRDLYFKCATQSLSPFGTGGSCCQIRPASDVIDRTYARNTDACLCSAD